MTVSLTPELQAAVQAERTSEGTVIRFDTRQAEGRRALDLTMRRLGPEGRELKQAEAGVRMGLEQRRSAMNGHPLYKAGRVRAARIVLKGAIKRLRKARAVFEPVTIPALTPIAATVRKLDPAIWGADVAASLEAAE